MHIRSRGQALVFTALVMPLLIILLMGTVDFFIVSRDALALEQTMHHVMRTVGTRRVSYEGFVIYRRIMINQGRSCIRQDVRSATPECRAIVSELDRLWRERVLVLRLLGNATIINTRWTVCTLDQACERQATCVSDIEGTTARICGEATARMDGFFRAFPFVEMRVPIRSGIVISEVP